MNPTLCETYQEGGGTLAEMDKRTAEQLEIARLMEIYKGLPPKRYALAQGLIAQAARLRVQLDVLSTDIAVNGLTEQFQQSDKVEPYTRERPEAALFVKLDKNFQSIIKLLTDTLPAEDAKPSALTALMNGGEDE
jgi:hypothetical protein